MFFASDDWAEDHHDVELVDEQGRGSWCEDDCLRSCPE